MIQGTVENVRTLEEVEIEAEDLVPHLVEVARLARNASSAALCDQRRARRALMFVSCRSALLTGPDHVGCPFDGAGEGDRGGIYARAQHLHCWRARLVAQHVCAARRRRVANDDTWCDRWVDPANKAQSRRTDVRQLLRAASLDNLVSTGSGTTGGTEMAAVYDTLMRYDPEIGKYEGRTAETVTSSADFLEWTIKLRPGVKFSDGTPYDAEAVAFGLNRHRVGTSIPAADCAKYWACPRNSTSSGVYMALVKDIQVVDTTTLKITSTNRGVLSVRIVDEASMIPRPQS